MTCYLYLTSNCTLCDDALNLVIENPQALNGQLLETVDIVSDDSLFEKYSTVIPVFSYRGTDLNWPFDVAMISAITQTK